MVEVWVVEEVMDVILVVVSVVAVEVVVVGTSGWRLL